MIPIRNIKKVLLVFLLTSMVSCGENRESPEFKETYIEEINEPDIQMEDTDEGDIGETFDMEDITATIDSETELSHFSNALSTSNIPDFENGIFTIFAPRNDAVELLSEDDEEWATENSQQLASYHIVEAKLSIEDLKEKAQVSEGTYSLSAIDGSEIEVTLENGELMLGKQNGEKARIIESLYATNGVIHVIDKALWPAETP